MKIFKNNSFYGFIISLTLIFINSCEQPQTVNLVEAPDQIISVLQAKKMYDSYTERRLPIIKEFEDANQQDSALNFEPTRYGWYDYTTIKQYLAYIEKEAKEAGVEISGLQFYFANYPANEKYNNGEMKKYAGQNSFFIVPTLRNNKEDKAFCISLNSNGKKEAVLLQKLIPRLKVNEAMNGMSNKNNPETNAYKSRNADDDSKSDSTYNTNSLILNESNLVPPPHKTDMD